MTDEREPEQHDRDHFLRVLARLMKSNELQGDACRQAQLATELRVVLAPIEAPTYRQALDRLLRGLLEQACSNCALWCGHPAVYTRTGSKCHTAATHTCREWTALPWEDPKP